LVGGKTRPRKLPDQCRASGTAYSPPRTVLFTGAAELQESRGAAWLRRQPTLQMSPTDRRARRTAGKEAEKARVTGKQ
jgi:hypothetical protein